MIVLAYQANSNIGVVLIKRSHDGRWHAIVGDEDLGSYHSAEAAHDDLIGGHTFSHSSGISTAKIGLPNDLAAWSRIIAR